MRKSICIFNISKIKSKEQFKISENNSFGYNFSEFKSQKSQENEKNKGIKDKQQSYNKQINMNIPSNDILKDENLLNEFFHNYDTSFSKFCGINKKMYKEIFEKVQYISKLNKNENIQIDINDIIKMTKKFSSNKIIKIHRRLKNKKIYGECSKNESESLISKKRHKIISNTKYKVKINQNNDVYGENIITEKKDSDLCKQNDGENIINLSFKINNIKNDINDIHIASNKKTLFDIKSNLAHIKIKNNSEKETNSLSKKNEGNHNILSNDIIINDNLETNKHLDNYKAEEQFFIINNEQYDNNILNLISRVDNYYLPNNLSLSNDEENKYNIKLSPNIYLFNPNDSQNTFVDNLSNGNVQSTNIIRNDMNNLSNNTNAYIYDVNSLK